MRLIQEEIFSDDTVSNYQYNFLLKCLMHKYKSSVCKTSLEPTSYNDSICEHFVPKKNRFFCRSCFYRLSILCPFRLYVTIVSVSNYFLSRSCFYVPLPSFPTFFQEAGRRAFWSVNGPRIVQVGYEDEEDSKVMEAYEQLGSLV